MTSDRGGENYRHRDEHRELRDLLPWYVTGQLDAAEAARVEAHLDECAECEAEIRFEERLEAEVARLPLDVEQGWARMRQRLANDRPGRRVAQAITARAPWLGWGVAAAMMLSIGVMMSPGLRPAATPDAYHTLGAPPIAAAGNVVVIFRPDTTERQMREVLRASNARLVDGPTQADAYVLQIPAARRELALTTLRARHEVVLAQPIDGAAR
jgi:anti-sigma factor RsiW